MSHSQLQVLFLLTIYSFSIFGYKECSWSDFSIDYLVMSMGKPVSCVVEKKCLLWSVHYFGRFMLAFTPLHFVFQGQTCPLLQVSLNFLLLHSNPLWWIRHLFLVFILGGLLGLHRTDQLQLLWHSQLGHRFGLMWCWMVCLGNELRSFCLFWGCTQVLHFRLFCLLWGLLHLLYVFFPTIEDIMAIWIKFTHSHPF